MIEENRTLKKSRTVDPIPLSLLNDFLYCPRRAGLKEIEGVRSGNVHTLQGDIIHEHADLAGYELQDGVKLLRALPVFSERLGLSGKCDIVEVHGVHSGGGDSAVAPEYSPVDYKKGRRRAFENDDVQLCAQALCMEEMFGVQLKRGAVFHAASKHRREVVFTPELRRSTEDAVTDLRRLVESGHVPPAVFKPQCEECSLFQICLPAATSASARVARELKALFQT